jgi:transglutaminase superfamily protein
MSAGHTDDWLGRSFSPREKIRLGIEIVVAYSRARWLLWRCDLPTTVAALRSPATPTAPPRNSTRAGLRLGQAMGRTLRHLPFDSRCLMRSLVLTRLLAQRGIDSSLVIAVLPEPRFRAHAWVEREGVPLLEPAGPPFQIITQI